MSETETERAELGRELAPLGLRLERKLGQGSYSTVWAVNGNRAAKIIRPAKLMPRYATHFVPRELAILRRIRHPNLITVHAVHDYPRLIVIETERAEGGDLLSHIRRLQHLDESRACFLFRQLVEALHYLHSRDIAHRDIKCENCLFDQAGNLKLCDLGFARYHSATDSLSTTWCGSAAYAAPEVLRSRPYDPFPADRWSAGVLLYIIITGLMPFDDRNVNQMVEKQEAHRVHYSRRGGPVSFPAKALINSLLDPNPTRRPRYSLIISSSFLCQTPWSLIRPTVSSDSAIAGARSSDTNSGLRGAPSPHHHPFPNITPDLPTL